MDRSNKDSCRACGNKLSATERCRDCYEPVRWECDRCGWIDDSLHVHRADLQESIQEQLVT